MFYCREKELDEIQNALKKESSAILIYGKRRVGKTSLILNASKGNKTFVYFECLKDSLTTNVSLFIEQCKKSGIQFPSYFRANNFLETFEYLDSLKINLIISIDEYPYLKLFSNSDSIDSSFQFIIDHYIKHINLIISGSEIRMMEQILNEKNPLFGRFENALYIDELDYIDVSNFYKSKTIYEKVGFYSVFGGSPFINEYIDESKSLKENIIQTYLKRGSGVYNYADSLLLSDAINELNARSILAYLGNGKKRYKEIMDKLDVNKTGAFNRSLISLIKLRILSKNEPINKRGDVKKSSYEINDNVLRFYFTYVYKNMSQLEMLGPESFYDEYIAPTISSYISYRFESQCRMFFSLLVKNNKMHGIKSIGTYYFDDQNEKTNGEFDVAIENKNGFEIFEVKYLKNPLSSNIMFQEEGQIRKIKELKINNIGFISINGFEEKIEKYTLYEGKDLYFVK